ncbi:MULTISPECIES: O-antigen ligase family protein [Streptomyces]|uniref:O-antigen ligase family protein n=1 Tax=Streptomyces flaveolus TaxID=67297 RepID=A0ABV3A5A6_9ACTN|nr:MULTISPECIES: O-antigen ligase family protein [Streptomyces]KMS66126.1 membrane protein [Streptomyces regensis]
MALTLPFHRPARPSPALPVLAVVALLALPVASGDEGGAGPADALSALVVLFCAVRLLRARRRPLTRTAALILGLPVAGLALAALHAVAPGAGITGLGRYLQVFVLVPAAVVLLVRGRADFRLLAWSVVALAGWQGALGVHQYVTGTGASYQGQDIRAVGTFGATDVMGMATVVSFGLVCAVGLAFGRSTERGRAFAACCALALAVPLALSFSRGAWIATAVTVTVQLVLAGLRRALKAGAAVLAAGVVLVGGFGVGTTMLQERFDSITQVTDAPDQSVTDRYTMWAAAIDMWRERPLTGVGLKGFPEHRDGHASLALSSGSDIAGAGAAYRRQPLLSPHNMYLLVLSEQGLLGLLCLAGSWLALLVCALRGLWRTRAAGGRSLDCALIACGLLVWQLVDFAYADIGGPSTVLTAVCFGLVAWWALVGADRAVSCGSTSSLVTRERVTGEAALR